MTTALAERHDADAIEQALIGGDLSRLTAAQRVSFYKQVCDSLGLNPLTKPFAYLPLNGKLVLYALKDCTEQLRKMHNVSVQIVAREAVEDCYVVTARATLPSGRCDESLAAVPLPPKGDARANAMMKAETKAKRRVTLSICGLGMLDETEIDTIPRAAVTVDPRPALSSAATVDAPSVSNGDQPDPCQPPDDSFADWWKALDEAADCGTTALQKVWEDKDAKAYRKFVADHRSAEWMALKQRAVQVAA